MNCSAPLPGDDDGPFQPNDPMLPIDGATPAIDGEAGPGTIGAALRLAGLVVAVVIAATIAVAAVQQ
jgi:hypothetical protein